MLDAATVANPVYDQESPHGDSTSSITPLEEGG
jgi:hypothetical protein